MGQRTQSRRRHAGMGSGQSALAQRGRQARSSHLGMGDEHMRIDRAGAGGPTRDGGRGGHGSAGGRPAGDEWREELLEPLVFAHRGSSELLPEHTMAAYLKALDEGADGLE